MSRILYLGCAPGSDVATLQTDLNRVQSAPGQLSQYEKLIEDGIFGAKTHNRVTEFQRLNRLTANGIAGPATLQKLQTLITMLPPVSAASVRVDISQRVLQPKPTLGSISARFLKP